MSFALVVSRVSMALGAVIVALTASAACAQDIGWKPAFNAACSPVVSNVDINMRQITQEGTGKVSIAHRGVYAQQLPYVHQYPAENTILAFQLAQCQGFAGVEVDLKSTSDDDLILAHDINLMRFTNEDGNDGNFDPIFGARVTIGHEQLRPYSGNTAPAIATQTASQIEQTFKFVKTYDAIGIKSHNQAIENPASIKLEYVLNLAKTDSTLNKVVWILDIQSYAQLTKVIDIVDRLNVWDRVVLKCWMGAIPVTLNEHGEPELKLPKTNGFAHWVFAISPINSKFVGSELQTETYNAITGSKVFVPTDWILTELNYVFFESGLKNAQFDGIELLLSGGLTAKEMALDNAIRNLPTSGFYPAHGGRAWGVIRLPDYDRENCGPHSASGNCTVFPDGEYYGRGERANDSDATTIVRFNQVQAKSKLIRRAFATTRSVETEDIRWLGGWRFINSPLQRTTFFATQQPSFSQ